MYLHKSMKPVMARAAAPRSQGNAARRARAAERPSVACDESARRDCLRACSSVVLVRFPHSLPNLPKLVLTSLLAFRMTGDKLYIAPMTKPPYDCQTRSRERLDRRAEPLQLQPPKQRQHTRPVVAELPALDALPALAA